jgi:Family of unknown function (DUF6188)
MVSIEILDPDRENVMITVEQEFCLNVRGQEYLISPKEPTRLGPLFLVLHKTINAALAFKNGVLEIEFIDGDKLRVRPHPKYEAWSIVGDRGLRIISVPGGDLAVWKPQ